MLKQILISACLLIAAPALAQNNEQMIGCWTMSTRAGEYMQLDRDGRFAFHDWNKAKSQWDDLSGTWEYETLKGGTGKLTLYYDDRTKQTFTLKKDKAGKWTMTKVGGFLFRKADPSDCAVEDRE